MKHRKARKPARRKKARSAAQKAATRALVALMHGRKAGAPRKHPKRTRKAHRHGKVRKPTVKAGFSGGKHRPVVIFKGGRIRRPKKSRIRPHAKFVNPFLGELAVLGNPRRRHHMKHRRSLMLTNPVKGSIAALTEGPKSMMKMEFIKDAVSVGVGYMLPNMVIYKMPGWARDAHWKIYASKVVVVSALAGMAGIISKRAQKAVLLGGAVSILQDLYVDFIAPRIFAMSAPAAAPAGTSTYYGMDAYYGGHELGDMDLGGVGSLADTY